MEHDDLDVDDEALKSIIDRAHGKRGQALLTVILGGEGEPDEHAAHHEDDDEDDTMP